MVEGWGLRVWCLLFRVESSGLGVERLGFGFRGLGLRVSRTLRYVVALIHAEGFKTLSILHKV